MTWRRVYSRPHDLQTDYFGRCLWFTVNKWFKLKHLEIIPDAKGQADHFVIAEEWDELMKRLSKEIFRPTQTIEKLQTKFSEYEKNLLRTAKILQQAKELDPQQLQKAYQVYMSRRITYTYFFWLPWAINEVVDPWFQVRLKKKFPKKFQFLYDSVSHPTLPNRMEIQQRQLVAMQKLRLSLLKTHTLKWGYLAVYSFNEPAWTANDFSKQWRSLRRNKFIQQTHVTLRTNRKNLTQALSVLRKDKELLRIARIISYFNYLRTERVDVWREVLWQMQSFFRELERRYHLPKFTGPFLMPEEIELLLAKGVSPGTRPLLQRKRGNYILRIVNGKVDVEERRSRVSAIRQRLLRVPRTLSIIGTSVYPGIVRGRVRIVKVLKDLPRFPVGAVLVSPMTHPDYVLAIHKASAIVTDEGGISCHAAIAARELGIPCVTGTKIATKALRDGDRVEVNADKGIVRKL